MLAGDCAPFLGQSLHQLGSQKALKFSRVASSPIMTAHRYVHVGIALGPPSFWVRGSDSSFSLGCEGGCLSF